MEVAASMACSAGLVLSNRGLCALACRWEDVTVEGAQAVYTAFSRLQWSYGRLYMGYWERQIYELRRGKLKAKRIIYALGVA